MRQNGSIELVVMGLLAALVVVLAIPLVGSILEKDALPKTRLEEPSRSTDSHRDTVAELR